MVIDWLGGECPNKWFEWCLAEKSYTCSLSRHIHRTWTRHERRQQYQLLLFLLWDRDLGETGKYLYSSSLTRTKDWSRLRSRSGGVQYVLIMGVNYKAYFLVSLSSKAFTGNTSCNLWIIPSKPLKGPLETFKSNFKAVRGCLLSRPH